MFNLDPSKLLVIAVVMIIVLGPDRLPHFARQVGSVWRSFSEFRQRMESEVRHSLPDLPSTTELANYAVVAVRIARSPFFDDTSRRQSGGQPRRNGRPPTDRPWRPRALGDSFP